MSKMWKRMGLDTSILKMVNKIHLESQQIDIKNTKFYVTTINDISNPENYIAICGGMEYEVISIDFRKKKVLVKTEIYMSSCSTEKGVSPREKIEREILFSFEEIDFISFRKAGGKSADNAR